MFSHNTEHLKFSVVHKSKLLPEFLSVHICKQFLADCCSRETSARYTRHCAYLTTCNADVIINSDNHYGFQCRR